MVGETKAKNIQEALLEVYMKVGYVQKTGKMENKYRYASEADFIEAVRPAMLEAGIVVYPCDIKDIQQTESTKSKGSYEQLIYHYSATYVYCFSHAESQTSIMSYARGEGIDYSGDKASYKAATGAYKYALRQTFLIETGDDPDNTPSGALSAKTAPAKVSAPAKQPLISIPGIAACETQGELVALWRGNGKTLKELQVNNPDVYQSLEAAKDKRKTELGAQS